MAQCDQHAELQGDIKTLVAGQIQIQQEMSGIGKTLLKLEDTNIQLVAMRGDVSSLSKSYERTEIEHAEIFDRIRKQEDVSAERRLKVIETRLDKILWSGILSVGLLLVGGIVKMVVGK